MSREWGNIPRRQLMETITLLWTLTEVPEAPKENTIPVQAQPTQQLTLEHEIAITEFLAFLSVTSDDSLKVMAVCIEESHDRSSLIIRLASNTGDCSDAAIGFNEVARILERSSLRAEPKDECSAALLRQIVCLAFAKILSRLRSRHAKTTRKTLGKQALMVQLCSALKEPSIEQSRQVPRPILHGIRSQARRLEELFLKLEEYPDPTADSEEVQNLLMNIVEQANNLTSTDKLPIALGSSRLMNPNLKIHLSNAIGKLGRYFSASRDLISAARSKKYSVFSKITVENYQIPQSNVPLFPGIPSTLEKSIEQLIPRKKSKSKQGVKPAMKAFLGSSYLTKSESFQSHVSACHGKQWKVHAEIQLVFHYEINPDTRRPRVISSSKSACYLCDLFVKIHGGFHIPRSHGRLYDKWVLPTWLTGLSDERQEHLGRVIQEFHAVLRRKIGAILSDKRRSYTHPNESVILPLAKWSASSEAVASKTASFSALTVRLTSADSSNADTAFVESRNPAPPEPSLAPGSRANTETISTDVVERGRASEEDLVPRDTQVPIQIHFCQGRAVQSNLYSVVDEFHFETEHLSLTIGAGLSSTIALDRSVGASACWVQVTRFEKVERIQAGTVPSQVVNVRDMSPGSEVVSQHGALHSPTELFILEGQDLVSIKFGEGPSSQTEAV